MECAVRSCAVRVGVFHAPPPVRYLKVTLFIGFLVSLLVSSLYWFGVMFQLDLALRGFLGLCAPTPRADWHWQVPLYVFFAFAIAWTTVDIPRFSHKVIIASAAL